MRLDSKLTWGLAWTGLAIVVAVPSVDFVSGRLAGGGSAAVLTSTTDPVTTTATAPASAAPATATVPATPAKTPAASTAPSPPVKTASVTTELSQHGITITPNGAGAAKGDAVDSYLKSGKTLPDYITPDDSGAASATSPTPVARPDAAKPDATRPEAKSETPATKVASVDPVQPVAPIPFPASARPRPSLPAPVVVPTVTVEQGNAVEVPVANAGPVPPAPIASGNDEWDPQTLREYLERRGILDDGSGTRSRATVTVTERGTDYDPDGFYLSDGPNNDRVDRRARLRRQWRDDPYYDDEDDSGFSLF